MRIACWVFAFAAGNFHYHGNYLEAFLAMSAALGWAFACVFQVERDKAQAALEGKP